MTTPDVSALLDAHPWIEDARLDPDGRTVRIRPVPSAVAVRPDLGGLVEEFLGHWSEVYDWTYTKGEEWHADDLDLSGWRASDTGRPFPSGHMRDWADHTVSLILGHRPGHVLELGCGTGLLMHRLRDHVSGYVGTDVAEAAVERLRAGAHANTSFIRAAAHQLGTQPVRAAMDRLRFPGARPDFIVLNSVTQCFPNAAYLEAVIRDAIEVVAPGGAILVGDVRDARLLPAFCRWVEKAASPEAAPDELDRRAAERAEREAEFLFDPPLLAGLAARIGVETGRRVRMSVHPKTMRADTELSRYRFDVVLRVDVPAPPVSGTAGRTEPAGGRTAAMLRDIAGTAAAVVADPHDPASLAVVSPAEAAAVPVEEIAPRPATAHEPFGAFVERRLAEVATAVLRRAGTRAAIVVERAGAEAAALPARAAEAAAAKSGPEPAALTGFLRRLDEVALMAMCATLRPAAGTREDGFTAAEIADDLRVAARHRWILRRWLAALAREGHLARAGGDRYGRLRHVTRRQVAAAGRGLAEEGERAGYPADTTAFMLSAMARLPELLRDEVRVQQLLFGDDGTAADGAYRDNGVNRHLNAGVGEVLRWTARSRDQAGPLRVLELGAGVGGTTAEALDALAGEEIDYLFTDVSRYFLSLGRERFGDRSGVRFATFDINGDPQGQGPAAGSLDVVLSANVLHNARDAGKALRELGRLLTPGGLFVFVETGREMPAILASMQFLMSAAPDAERLDPADPRAADDRVFLTAPEWEGLLRRSGLRPWFRLPAEDHPLADAGLHLFVARRADRRP